MFNWNGFIYRFGDGMNIFTNVKYLIKCHQNIWGYSKLSTINYRKALYRLLVPPTSVSGRNILRSSVHESTCTQKF